MELSFGHWTHKMYDIYKFIYYQFHFEISSVEDEYKSAVEYDGFNLKWNSDI